METTTTEDSGMMDYEMDIDLTVEDEAELEAMNIEPENTTIPQHANFSPAGTKDVAINTALNLDLVEDKVHIRGLDNLTTHDVLAFASEYYPSTSPTRVEWINDTSANIVYPSSSDAIPALQSFLTASTIDLSMPLLDLHLAKPLPNHPSTTLTVRSALITDVKKPRAHEASRFYLLNPDKDPRSQPRLGRYDTRRDRRSGGGRKRSREADDDDENPPAFDENMYDDDPDSLAARVHLAGRARATPKRRRRSEGEISEDETAGQDEGRRLRNAERGDLFARVARGRGGLVAAKAGNGGYGRLRDRSASPLRDGDGRLGFVQEDVTRATARRRSATPPQLRARIAEKERAGNEGKELFFVDKTGRSGILDEGSAEMATEGRSVELFPAKTSWHGHGHKRSDAIDAKDDMKGGGKGRDLFERVAAGGGRSLADRITGGPEGSGDEEMQGGFNIRGSARDEQNPGFTIRGLGANHAKVKELFPGRAPAGERNRANAGSGKDLFENRIRGRRKAEDLFA